MTAEVDHDVIVVGGGPTGCSAAVFLARAGLETVVYDRGRSSIGHCAHLENYLGFPRGIDIETLYGLLHDHVAAAGASVVDDMVESVAPRDSRGDTGDEDGETAGSTGFVVAPQEGEPATARRVVAAARYDGEFLRGLDDDAAMFETVEHGDDSTEQFARDYADDDGTTPVEGLYVAAPAGGADEQAIVAAGRGARVSRRVVADARIDDGWWEAVATSVDWMRREAALDEEWAERDRWNEWFDDRYGDEAPVGTDTERYRRVREAVVDEFLSTYLGNDEIDARAGRGHRALATRLDPAAVVAAHDPADLLDEFDEEALRAYLDGDAGTAG